MEASAAAPQPLDPRQSLQTSPGPAEIPWLRSAALTPSPTTTRSETRDRAPSPNVPSTSRRLRLNVRPPWPEPLRRPRRLPRRGSGSPTATPKHPRFLARRYSSRPESPALLHHRSARAIAAVAKRWATLPAQQRAPHRRERTCLCPPGHPANNAADPAPEPSGIAPEPERMFLATCRRCQNGRPTQLRVGHVSCRAETAQGPAIRAPPVPGSVSFWPNTADRVFLHPQRNGRRPRANPEAARQSGVASPGQRPWQQYSCSAVLAPPSTEQHKPQPAVPAIPRELQVAPQSSSFPAWRDTFDPLLVSHQQSRKKSVAVVDAGNRAQKSVFQCRRVQSFRCIFGDNACGSQPCNLITEWEKRKIGMGIKSLRDYCFILFRLQRASRIEQPSSRCEPGQRRGQNLHLPGPLSCDLVFAHAKAYLRIAANCPRACARDVAQDEVILRVQLHCSHVAHFKPQALSR